VPDYKKNHIFMKNSWWLTVALLLSSLVVKAQEDIEIDSTGVINLNNAVITGQYSAQSIDKSIYQVEVISADDIKNFAGNTVADVLNQNLNLLIIPNPKSGDSQADIMGLTGDYVKVLVDNIPLVGDSGMGNSIDLTKINLDNVERIEIVKGSMGVDYGNNALGGVINIITKKNLKNKWRINATVQEETVGNEYDWYEDGGLSKGKGRHIQALEIGHKFSDKWNISAGINHNDFQGFWDRKKGKEHMINDTLRGYEWLPKEQWNANGILNYHTKNFRAFYKLSYLNEEINSYNSNVKLVNLANGARTFHADDRDYFTTRWTHHLNIHSKLFNKILYNGDFSYQTQERKFEDYVYDVPTRTEVSRKDELVYLSTKSFYSRGTFSNFLDKQNIDFQVGYEIDNIKGFANAFAGSFGFEDDVDKKINTYAGFASAEFHTHSGFSLRPGFRASFNNKFDPQYNYSLSGKYNLTPQSNIRAVIGTANRYPNFEELYTNTIDANHEIMGDENLMPEKGYSSSIQWNHRLRSGDIKLENNLSTTYINLDDKIELVNTIPGTANYKYMSLDKFQSWGVSTGHHLKWRNLNVNAGASLFGTSKSLYSSSFSSDNNIEDEFRYTFQANASANYTIPKWAATFSVYYKYTGKTTEYVMDITNSTPENTLYRLGEREGFSLMDASVRKGFFKDRFEVTLGARNIFDLTSVRNTIIGETGHGEASPTQALFYGRSYFLKLNYNLEF